MRRIAVLAVLALAACGDSQGSVSTGPVPMQGWRQTASGKPPTRAEFAAVLAACQDRQKSGRSGSIDQCLADLGLRRAP
jgi:hypothetical protein